MNPETLTTQQAIDLALRHHAAGRLSEAESIYQRILQTDPNQPAALHLLGVIAHQMGKNDVAVDLITKALAIAPSLAEAQSNLGLALQGLGRLEEAVASYRKALAIKPDYAEAHNNLGNALTELGQSEEAVASFCKALAIRPNYAEAHNNLGIALHGLGKINEAVASYHKSLAIAPDYADALYNLCEAFEGANDTEGLRETVNKARQNCPEDPRFALREAQLLKRDGEYESARAVLETAGEGGGDANFLRVRTHLLGELCDRLGDSHAAYGYFSEGNSRSKDTPEAKQADGGIYVARIDALAERFTSDWVSSWQNFECTDDRPDPVFLIGFPRSGTTLLDSILNSHRAITVVEEKPTVRNMRHSLEQLPGGCPDGLAALDASHLASLRQVYFAELDKHLEPRDRSAMIVDKLPLNAVEAGLIHRIFPQARFVFAQRHPCDCVLSCFMQSFGINTAMTNFLDLEDAARLYDRVMALWRQYGTVLPLEHHPIKLNRF